MNAKIIVALEGIRDNLDVIIKELGTPVNVSVTEVESKVEEKTEAPVETAPMSRKEKEASETMPDVTGTLTEEQLNSLSYNNLKKLAKDLGIPAIGSRDELTAKILKVEVTAPAKEEVEETEEAPVEKAPKATKTSKKVEPVAEPKEDDEEDEEEEDPIVAKVMEAVEDMTNEEIADILADVGVKAKGKRQALISAVIKAVQEGKIDLDDEEEEEAEAPQSEAEDSEDEEFDVNDPNNPDMTEERKTALVAHENETREGFESGEITRKEIVQWLNDYHGTKDTMKKKSDDEILEDYIYCSSLLIDDEGEMPEEEGAYTVNGIPYCCGHELAYNEDNETYICETCGAEYEAE